MTQETRNRLAALGYTSVSVGGAVVFCLDKIDQLNATILELSGVVQGLRAGGAIETPTPEKR